MINLNEVWVKRVEELVRDKRNTPLCWLGVNGWVFKDDSFDLSMYTFTREELDVLIAHFRVQGIGSEWTLSLLENKA